MKPTKPAATTEPAKETLNAIHGGIVCPDCLCKMEPVLERDRQARFNPARIQCVQPSCKNVGKVFTAPTIQLVAE